MKRLKRKVTIILACALIIAQMPATYSNATETNAVQETNSEATNNEETEQGSANETQVINGESTKENAAEGNTIESSTTQTPNTQVEIGGEETEQVETGNNSENIKDTVQVPTTTVDETNLMSNSTSSTVEAVKGSADTYSLIIENGGVLTGYTGTVVDLVIPTTVTSIKEEVFKGNADLQTVTIEGDLTVIGFRAFQNCTKLRSVTIIGSIESMEVSVFDGCTGLVNTEGFIIVGELLCQYLGAEENVTIPDGIKHIGNYSFYKCNNLASIKIPEGVTSIGNSAFYGCSNLGSIKIPEGVTSIADSAFNGCSNLESIKIPEGVTSIGSRTFYECSKLERINIPEGVTSIGDGAFYECSNLRIITIPEGVTNIGSCTFYGCSNLGIITIPEGVTSIEDSAFDGCSKLVINCEPNSPAAQYAKDKSIATTKVYVNNISLNESNLSLISGKTATLIKTVSPDNAINKKVTWSSSDTNVAIVDSTGVVTAVSGGTAVISATAQDGGSVMGSCTVNVSVSVQSVSLNTTELSLLPKESTALTATILPANTTNKNVTWSSSDSNIATVDSTGNVTAVSAGTATIAATTEDGNKTATCTINVKQIEVVKPVSVESVSIKESTLNLATGQATTLTATVLPDNAANKNVTWSSSNTNIATVDSTGKVTAVSAGTASITATTQDATKIATCTINVMQIETAKPESILVNEIKLNSTKLTLGKNAQIKLKATTSPENATSANVTWASSNTNVATVSAEGIVKAIALGTADITATAQDGSNVTNTCKVTVSKNKSYTIKYKLNKGQNADLNPSYYPIKTKLKLQNPTRKGYTFAGWYVGDKKVTSIDKKTTGKITVTAKWEKTSVDKTTIKKASNNQAGSIAVSFDKVSGAKGYTVYYSTDKKLKNASEIEANSKKKSATITNLQKGTTYYVIVKAYKTDSEGNRVYGKSNKTMKVKINK